MNCRGGPDAHAMSDMLLFSHQAAMSDLCVPHVHTHPLISTLSSDCVHRKTPNTHQALPSRSTRTE